MIYLKKIIALFLCTSMFVNISVSSVEASIENIKSLSLEENYSNDDENDETIKTTRKVFVREKESKDVVSEIISDEKNETSDNLENTQQITKEVKIIASDFIRIYKGEVFDEKANVQGISSKGEDISKLVTVEGEVDTNKVGSYELKYFVTDETGKTATLTRKVNVINKNIFNRYIEKVNEETKKKIKELAFSIYLDNNTSKFLVENQSKEQLDTDRKDEVVFKIRVIDKDNKEKLSVELLGSDTGDSEKLNSLKELEYSFGDYIEIKTEDAKERFNIEGEMLGDIKAKVDGNSNITENDKIEDYSDGVDNMDYISNVRFKITEEGIKTVYNEAPIITGLEPMSNLLKSRGQQLEGIKVIDDHDGVIPNEKISITEEKDDKDNVIGLKYQVSDSWGRTISIVRDLIRNQDHIESEEKISRYTDSDNRSSSNNTFNRSLKDNIIKVYGVKYKNVTSTNENISNELDQLALRFEIKFNIDTKKIEIHNRDNRLFDNKLKDEVYFEFVLYDKLSNEKARLTINGNDKANAKKLDEFNGTTFEYGDQIALYHYYSDTKLKIKGSILGKDNNLIDYNDGVPANDILVNRLQIAQNGLNYLANTLPEISGLSDMVINRGETPDLLSGVTVNDAEDGVIPKSRLQISPLNVNKLGEQIITYTVTDSWGGTTTKERKITVLSDSDLVNTSIDIKDSKGESIVFSIKFDDYTKKINIANKSDIKLNEESDKDVVFRIRIFNKAGITKKDVSLNGSDTGASNKLNVLEGYTYNEGDTIELWALTPKKSIIITGNLNKPDEVTEDYSDGIDELKFMNDVRFQVGESRLKVIYNTAPIINFKENLTIKRGEEFNPLSFISGITDDYDSLNISLVRAEYNKDEIGNVGEHTITYTISDKWGKSASFIKQITVLPKNNLEENKIQLLKANENGIHTAIATLYFDDVEKRIVDDVLENAIIEGKQNTNVFTVKLFDEDGNKVAESNIKANEGLTSSSFEEITSVNFENGYSIAVEAYSYDKVSLYGNIIEKKLQKITIDLASRESENTLLNHVKDKYKSGLTNDEVMDNTRFILNEDGLTEVYNEAPSIKVESENLVLKNQTFDAKLGVKVFDDIDSPNGRDIKPEEVVEDIDISKAGIQTVKYRVIDSWGRTTEQSRNIYIKPLLEENTIQLNNSRDEIAFTIGFDFKTMTFTVKGGENNSSEVEAPSEVSITDEGLNPTNENKEFSIIVYDSRNTVIKKVEVNGNNLNYLEEIQKITEIPLKVGIKIQLWSNTKNKIKINGNVIADNSVVEEYNKYENKDTFIDNLLFMGTEDGLKAIYNYAPIINIPEVVEEGSINNIASTNITLYKGDDYMEELLKNVTVEDGEGNSINTNELEITLQKVGRNNDDDESDENRLKPNQLSKLGTYIATYSVTDNFGRTSTVERSVFLASSIDRNVIRFTSHGAPDDPLVIGFDSEEMKIKVIKKNNYQFNNASQGVLVHKITIYNKSNNIVLGPLEMYGRTRGDDASFNVLNDFPIEYGYYIKFEGRQTQRTKIEGVVRDPAEDYTDGAQLGEYFVNSKFYITEEGLRAEYTPSVNPPENSSVFEFLGSSGRIPLRIIFDYNTNTMKLSGDDVDYIYREKNTQGYNQVVFTLKWHRANNPNNDIVIHRKSNDKGLNTNVHGNQYSGNENISLISNQRFNVGDYFTFVSDSSTALRFSGKFNTIIEDENFVDGIDNVEYMNNVRFEIKENSNGKYIEAVYNKAPEFKGVEEKNIYFGDTFNPQTGVIAVDDHDTGNLIYTVRGSDSSIGIGDHVYTQIGEYTYTYSATDSWGRIGTATRKVYVRPEIFKNRIMLYSKRETSTLSDNNLQEKKPAFEIGFDNQTGKYMVINQLNEEINPSVGDEVTFRISIYDKNGNHKDTIELNGTDTGTSEKFDRLRSIDYADDDIIRVWSKEPKCLRITGNITGDVIPGSENSNLENRTQEGVDSNNKKYEDYNDGIDNDDYMNNVAFQVNMNGLKSIYNEKPEFIGLDITREILFGEVLDLRDGITIKDDKDQLTKSDIKVVGNVNENQIGVYNLTYIVTDTWGRSTSKDVEVYVVSKIKNNEIHIYDSSNLEKFKMKFNVNTNKIEVENNKSNVLTLTDETTPEPEINSGLILKVIVRNRTTNIKAEVEVNIDETNDIDAFKKLRDITFSNEDTISIKYINNTNGQEVPEKNKIKITGNIENKETFDFTEGFPADLSFNDVRFKVTNKGFELVKRENPTIEKVSNLQIARGDEKKILEGINIIFVNKSNSLGVTINVKGFDAFKIGRQKVTYEISDSWGNSILVENYVTVVERRDLEKNKIKLLDSQNGNELVQFEFDTINKKIKPIINSREVSAYEGNLVDLKLYDSEGVTREHTLITTSDIISNNQIEEIAYEDGYSISIEIYNSNNRLTISNLRGFNNCRYDDDNLVNSRFTIEESGLVTVYNNAPILNIVGDLIVFRNESIDFLKNVTVSDSDKHDKDTISTSDIQIESNVDITQIGNYTATYTLYDSWGRSVSKTRRIIVKSSLENNKIEYYNNGKEPLISISIDNSDNKLKITKNYSSEKNILKSFKSSESDNVDDINSSNDNNSSSESDEKIFEVGLFDSNSKVKNKFTIVSTDNENTVNEKIREFNNTDFVYGDYISVYAKNHETDIKITGSIDKSINIDEDYSQGIKNPDYMKNVRFKINVEGLLVIYNEEPTMIIPEGTVEVYKGDDIIVYEGIKVSDDIDIDIKPSQIKISDRDRESLKQLGEHTVNLILTDSWGRSVQKERTFNVKNSIDRNKILFSIGSNVPLELSFNSTTKMIDIVQRNHQFNSAMPNAIIQSISIYSGKNNIKLVSVDMIGSEYGTNSKFQQLNRSFEYGDYIVFGGNQVFRTKIDGPVRNGAEDYTDGAQLGEYFVNSKFYITEEGFKAEYTPPVEVEEDETVFEFVASNGRIPLRIIFNYRNMTMKVSGSSTAYIYKEPGSVGYNDSVLRLTWYSVNGNVRETISYRGHDNGPGVATTRLNGRKFADGDYFIFESSYNSNIRISGNTIYNEDDEMYKEDSFADGVDNPENLTRTKFTLRNNTMEYVRVEAAKIKGADDIRIPQGSQFNKLDQVTAEDSDGRNLTNSITTVGNVNTDVIGMYQVIYEVTNREGIVTKVYRNINVYSESVISLKNLKIPPLEQGSIENSDEAIKNYLLTLVQADDPEDGDISNEIKVTSTTLNPEVSGKYTVSYSVENSFGEVATLNDIEIQVARTISVTVPTKLPFQVVTNLMDKEEEPFITGVLKLKNNKTSDVQVSVKGFSKKENSGELEIVLPESVDNWDELSEEESMKKIALGIFIKSGFKVNDNIVNDEENTTEESDNDERVRSAEKSTLWLTEKSDINHYIGIIPRATSLTIPSEAQLSFESKHGKKFIGGIAKGKFDLIFEFE